MDEDHELDRLGAARHVALTSFRSDGSAVTTTMWLVRDQDVLYALTHRAAGKLQRIRRNSHIELAPSDGRGRPQGGGSDATAQIVTDDDVVDRVIGLLRREYGISYLLLRGLMMTRGRNGGAPVALRISDPTPIEVTTGEGQSASGSR